jgi:hypothetical protein
MPGLPRNRVRDDFDGAWKNMLSERRFEAFIAFFMPEWHAQIDWSRGVVFLEQELRAITRKSRRGHRAVDKLARVWLLDGSERWVLVHVEIQSQEDAEFPGRMFQYRARAHDLFGDRSIACLAILGDGNPTWRPGGYTCSFWGNPFARWKLRHASARGGDRPALPRLRLAARAS